MSRSVALSPQFGSALIFGADSGRRRRAKSVHVPVPDGLRVVAVCVPDEAEETCRSVAGRPAPHRTPVAHRSGAAARRRQPTQRSQPRASVAGRASAAMPAAATAGRSGRPWPVDDVGARTAPRRVNAERAATMPRTSAGSARTSHHAPLRLTRRGQIVVTLLVTGLLLAIFSLGRFSAGAAGDPVPHRTVVVHSGDTLWSIAATAAPSADPRVTVDKIRLLNHLNGGAVQVGQQLQLP